MWLLESILGCKLLFIYSFIQQGWHLPCCAKSSIVSLKSSPSIFKVFQRRGRELYFPDSLPCEVPSRVYQWEPLMWDLGGGWIKRPLYTRGNLGRCMDRWQTQGLQKLLASLCEVPALCSSQWRQSLWLFLNLIECWQLIMGCRVQGLLEVSWHSQQLLGNCLSDCCRRRSSVILLCSLLSQPFWWLCKPPNL